MEILESDGPYDFRYGVAGALYATVAEEKRTRSLVIGESVKFDDRTHPADILSWVRLGKLVPELPAVGRYVALRSFPFRIPGGKMVEVRQRDIIEMRARDAGPLLLKAWIEPRDRGVWCPARLMSKKPLTLEEKIRRSDRDNEYLSQLMAGGKPRIGIDWKVRK